MARKKTIKPTFTKNWRERRVMHRTPGGKLTRVKIGSLPADEQQKYNPNRFKRKRDLMDGDFETIQQNQVDYGYIFDFYIQVKDESELDNLEEDTLLLATTDGVIVPKVFSDSDMIIMKLKNVPMDAVKMVAIGDEDNIDYASLDNIEFEDIDDLEGSERYEKIKFNETKIYQIDVFHYIDHIEKTVDMVQENYSGFYDYYYIGV